jgi:hypothetical protein
MFPASFSCRGDIAVRESSVDSERRCENNYTVPVERHDRIIWLGDGDYIID